jgi:hypothetical protein
MPWAGYFLKMAACDIFVFHDNVQLTKAGPTRRVKIASMHASEHTQWLTVPLERHSDYTLIKDLMISNNTDWRSRHLRLIDNTYRLSPYYADGMNVINDLYAATKDVNDLSTFNIYCIESLYKLINISVSTYRSSSLPVSGKADQYNANIVSYLGGQTYISGVGANNYQSESVYKKSGIELKMLDSLSILKKDEASNSEWQERHSIIEAIMYLGIDGVRELIEDFKK